MGVAFYFIARIGHGDCQPAIPHDRQVDYIVAHEARLGGAHLFLLQNFFEDAELVVDSLMHVVEFEVARAQSHSLRNTLGDQPGLDSA